MATSARRQSLQTAEPQPRYQEEYQRGYRTEGKRYRAGPQLYQAGANQPQYEEMQVQLAGIAGVGQVYQVCHQPGNHCTQNTIDPAAISAAVVKANVEADQAIETVTAGHGIKVGPFDQVLPGYAIFFSLLPPVLARLVPVREAQPAPPILPPFVRYKKLIGGTICAPVYCDSLKRGNGLLLVSSGGGAVRGAEQRELSRSGFLFVWADHHLRVPPLSAMREYVRRRKALSSEIRQVGNMRGSCRASLQSPCIRSRRVMRARRWSRLSWMIYSQSTALQRSVRLGRVRASSI